MNTVKRQGRFKEVAIFVAGTTPQIITETIYALIHQKPSVYPDEIYVLTTKKGKEVLKSNLLDSGIFKTFCKEFKFEETKFTENSIVVIKNRAGKLLDDIKEGEDNEALGDFIAGFIRDHANDESTRLHCSLAGGRKTMSYYIGSSLQLFGRPWDKLYHVLVTPEFESNPAFYYKPKKDRELTSPSPPLSLRGGRGELKNLHTKDARIYLAELPFIRLRNKISLNGKDFSELVREGQKEIDIATLQPELRVNLSERTVYIGDNLIEMVPVQLMIYAAYLRYKTERCGYPGRPYCADCFDCFPSVADITSRQAFESMVNEYRKIYSLQPMRAEELLDKHKNGMDQAAIRQNISKINRSIREQLNDETLLPYYIISSVKKYAGSRYGVRVEREKIWIE
jgi:CRISPR-associated protein Csx14